MNWHLLRMDGKKSTNHRGPNYLSDREQFEGYPESEEYPLAAGALYKWNIMFSPAIGAVLMSLSTIVVAVNAQLLKKLETLEATLKTNTKIVIPSGAELVNVIGDMAGVIPLR